MHRSKHMPSPALVVAIVALFVALGGVGVAATGGNFILGQSNTADAQSSLSGNPGTSAELRVQNSGGGPAISAVVNSGIAPFKVNSTTRVGGLNSDLLDSKDSTSFLPATADSEIWFSPYEYVKFNATLTLAPDLGPKVKVTSATASGNSVSLPLDLPQTVFGTPVKLKKLTVCYKVSNSRTKIDTTSLSIGSTGQNIGFVSDDTDRTSTSAGCYDVAPLSPASLNGSVRLNLFLSFGDATDNIELYGVKATIGP